MVIVAEAHKQMDFIYYWKIKQFNTWCLHDLLKQKGAIGELQNIAVIIRLNLHIVYLFHVVTTKANAGSCDVLVLNVYSSWAVILYLKAFQWRIYR